MFGRFRNKFHFQESSFRITNTIEEHELIPWYIVKILKMMQNNIDHEGIFSSDVKWAHIM